MNQYTFKCLGAATILIAACAAHGAEPIKIAHIDPMSGPFGLVGDSFAKHLDAVAAEINVRGRRAGRHGNSKSCTSTISPVRRKA